jgi:tetratricopeptide (TPR) repeat protein
LIGECYSKLGDKDSALEYYLKVEKLDDGKLFRKIGDIYRDNGQYNMAFDYYSKLNYN